MSEVVYDYDDLGRPIVADYVRDDEGRYVIPRAHPINPRLHDLGIGGTRGEVKYLGEGMNRKLVRLLMTIYRLGRKLGLPKYVINEAASVARREAWKLKGYRMSHLKVLATIFLTHAANKHFIHIDFKEVGVKANEVMRIAWRLGLKIANVRSRGRVIDVLSSLGIRNADVTKKAVEYIDRLFKGMVTKGSLALSVILALRYFGILVREDEVARLVGTTMDAITTGITDVCRFKIMNECYAEIPIWMR